MFRKTNGKRQKPTKPRRNEGITSVPEEAIFVQQPIQDSQAQSG